MIDIRYRVKRNSDNCTTRQHNTQERVQTLLFAYLISLMWRGSTSKASLNKARRDRTKLQTQYMMSIIITCNLGLMMNAYS